MNSIHGNDFSKYFEPCGGANAAQQAQGEIAKECVSLESHISRLNETIAQTENRLYSVLRSQTAAAGKSSSPGEVPRSSSTEMGVFVECQNYRLQAAISQLLTLIDRVEL